MRIRRVVTSLVMQAALFLAAAARPAEPAEQGGGLISELGCANCHSTLKFASPLRDRTVDISSAGLRFNPAYLLQYLQNPGKVRHHLGRARMPNFRFSEKEALALVQFLRVQTNVSGQWPSLPAEISGQLSKAPTHPARDQFINTLSGGLLCLNCHRFEGKGGAIGVELGEIGFRLQLNWIKSYLVSPEMYGISPAVMPPQFYTHSERQFAPSTADASGKIQILADFLFRLAEQKRRELDDQLRQAESRYPQATVSLGEAIFNAENCAACHRHHSVSPRTNSAPDLAHESERVTPSWLNGFLKKTTAIRPFGFHPGDGSRMPDFRLSDEEVRDVSTALLAGSSGAKASSVTNLSAFATQKARSLLNDKLACLGCHRFGRSGGRIGPELSVASNRLQPAYIFDMIRDPHRSHPETVMPRLPLSEPTVELIGSFILQEGKSSTSSEYLSLVDNRIMPSMAPPQGVTGRMNYLRYCSACHGPEGLGNGWNAPFLATKPTMHANAAQMSTRPDDTLFDGISSGGYILGKSPLMPAFGQSFSANEIRDLVGYIRTLCRCRQPAWAADNDSGAKPNQGRSP